MCDKYPARPNHFAHQFTRLIFRCCAAQDIGTEAIALLVAIVHTEDAKRYRAPVTFWNHQLESILAMSWGRLDRARAKAVESGWLHYESGGKGRVGRYWVTIPTDLGEMSDNSFDEDVISPSNMVIETVIETGDNQGTTALYLQNGDQNGERTGGQPGDNRGTTAEHSSLTLTLPLSHKETTSLDAGRGDKHFELFWDTLPRKTGGRESAHKAWQKAVDRVAKARSITRPAAAEFLIDRMALFKKSEKARGPYCPYPATWLNQGRYDDDPTTWSESNSRSHARVRDDTPVESERV